MPMRIKGAFFPRREAKKTCALQLAVSLIYTFFKLTWGRLHKITFGQTNQNVGFDAAVPLRGVNQEM